VSTELGQEVEQASEAAWWGDIIPYVDGRPVSPEKARQLFAYFHGREATDFGWMLAGTGDPDRKAWIERERDREEQAVRCVAFNLIAFMKELCGSAASGIEFKTPDGQTIDRVGCAPRALFAPQCAPAIGWDGNVPRIGGNG